MVELEPRLAEQTQVFQSRLYAPHTDSTLVVLSPSRVPYKGGTRAWRSWMSCTS